MHLHKVIHRTTARFLSVPDDALQYYPSDEWIIDPDLTAVDGVPHKYWKVDGPNVVVMSEQEQWDVDNDELTIARQLKNDALWQCARDQNYASISEGAYSLLDNVRDLSREILDNPASPQDDIDTATAGEAIAVADQQWIKQIWGDYYSRVATLDAATTIEEVNAISEDFSVHGAAPYSPGIVMYYGSLLGV